MTAGEATALVLEIQAHYQRELDEPAADKYIKPLMTLPYWWVRGPLTDFLRGAGREAKDRAFMPDVSSVLAGLGLCDETIRLIGRAERENATLERSTASLQWELVPRDGPVPAGVAQLARMNGRELPAGVVVAALPGPAEPPAVPGQRLGVLARALAASKAVEPRPPAPAPRAVRTLDDLQEHEREAAEAFVGRLERQAIEQERITAARQAMLDREIEQQMDGVSTPEALMTVAERCLAEIASNPLYGRKAATEVFQRAVYPTRNLLVHREALEPPNLVDLDGLDGPPEERGIDSATIVIGRRKTP